MAEAIPFLVEMFVFGLEVVLDAHLDDAVTLLILNVTEGRVRLRYIACRVLSEAKAKIASVERPQRMVHPVVEVKPELQLLALGDGKVLEQAHIPIEEGRSVNGRQDGRAVLADGGRHGKAIPVDVLVICQTLSWIASQDRVELDIRRAQDREIADRDTLGVLSRDAPGMIALFRFIPKF